LEDYRPIVIGSLDAKWRVQHISLEVTEVLGFSSEECIGVPVLDAVHPSEVAGVLGHMTALAQDRSAVVLRLRIRSLSVGWLGAKVNLCSMAAPKPYPFAFALTAVEGGEPFAIDENRLRDLELRLRRIALEVRAAGIALFPVLPAASRNLNALAELSPRQHEVLERLVAGQRTSGIARDLFLSQNTVRNHLSAIFRRFGVHSQSQLLECLNAALEPSHPAHDPSVASEPKHRQSSPRNI
jgi:DNA-binding CsgD family transcriptional regulator